MFDILEGSHEWNLRAYQDMPGGVLRLDLSLKIDAFEPECDERIVTLLETCTGETCSDGIAGRSCSQ